MKVLFVCHRVPFPPKRGGKIRPFNVIRHLTSQGHRVTVASLARNALEVEEAVGLREHCERVIVEIISTPAAWARMVARIPTAEPSSFGNFYSPELARKLRDEIRSGEYDLIFVHCSSVAPYVVEALARASTTALKVLDFGDMDSQKWREYVQYRAFPLSVAFRVEAIKLEHAERSLAAQFDLCTCTTIAELESLRSLGVSCETAWFPNGVDATFFEPAREAYDPDLVTFVGRMDYYPNQHAVNEFCAAVLPLLRKRRPSIRFDIVGADPPNSIRELGRIPGVRVTGSVPDVRPFVTRAALTVAPLAIARGTQNKILESMAMGVPVVCSVPASGGVDAVAGEHLLTASSPQEYVDAILSIIESPVQRAGLATRARERVLTKHAWANSMIRLGDHLEQAFRRRSGPRAAASRVA